MGCLLVQSLINRDGLVKMSMALKENSLTHELFFFFSTFIYMDSGIKNCRIVVVFHT